MEDNSIQNKINEVMKADPEFDQLYSAYSKSEMTKLESSAILKHILYLIPSAFILIFTFFLDVAWVPFLGRVSDNFSKFMFPNSPTFSNQIEPVSLWWLPLLFFWIFLLFVFVSYYRMHNAAKKDTIGESYFFFYSIKISSILIYIGGFFYLLAPILLLISIKQGPTMFIGFSLPVTIKSVCVLLLAVSFKIVFVKQADMFYKYKMKLNVFEKNYYRNKN